MEEAKFGSGYVMIEAAPGSLQELALRHRDNDDIIFSLFFFSFFERLLCGTLYVYIFTLLNLNA